MGCEPATQPVQTVETPRDDAMRAFLSALAGVQASAPTWSAGWSAHEVAAHVTAAAQERANLIEAQLAGKPARPTRAWEVREPQLRALPDQQLVPGTYGAHGTDVVIETAPDQRLLLLWGRCPAALRSPTANAETVDDVLTRLCR